MIKGIAKVSGSSFISFGQKKCKNILLISALLFKMVDKNIMEVTVRKFKAYIRIGNGGQTQLVYISADNMQNAKMLLEAQYGKGSISGSIMNA